MRSSWGGTGAAVQFCLLQATRCCCWGLWCYTLQHPLTRLVAAVFASRGRLQLHVVVIIMQEVPQQLPVLLLGLLLHPLLAMLLQPLLRLLL
jgi:hypothetical protein